METKERMTAQQIKNELPQFTGTEFWYKHYLGFAYTDGVKFVCDESGNHGAYWFLDVIGSYQYIVGKEPFQVWKLVVNLETETGLVTCEDGNGNLLCKQEIPSTDFNLPEMTFWMENKVVFLPLER